MVEAKLGLFVSAGTILEEEPYPIDPITPIETIDTIDTIETTFSINDEDE